MSTAIEWTDETWNPVTGCDKVSPGCDHCYIERTVPFRIEGRRFNEDGRMGIRLHPDRLEKPLHWRKPRLVFVNSLSDLFHKDIPDAFIGEVFGVMAMCPDHTFQVLTKRPQRMASLVPSTGFHLDVAIGVRDHGGLPVGFSVPTPNVWLGTSIESDRYTFRADHLRNTPAAIRWLSLEPLLGPLPSLDLTGIHWVVVGGESGPGARPMPLGWVRYIRDICATAGVPFFVKQLGAVNARERAMTSRAGHDIDEFPEDLRIREFPSRGEADT